MSIAEQLADFVVVTAVVLLARDAGVPSAGGSRACRNAIDGGADAGHELVACALLNQGLADCIDLQIRSKQAHASLWRALDKRLGPVDAHH